MSIDVEEHFQVWALADVYTRDQWDGLPSRVVANTERLIAALESKGRRATFFTLGWVARRHGHLVKRIVDGGHEIASHGFDHELLYSLDEDGFRNDIRDSKAILEDIAGEPVIGYRAPSFSIGEQTPWARRVLREEGYRYSSSVHPVANDHYGAGPAPSRPTRIDDLMEIPVSTLPLPLSSLRLPYAGGGYFRLLPHAWSSLAMRLMDSASTTPIVFYLHPWEIDPDQPRPANLGWKTRIRHYHGLGRCMDRFETLLHRFSWAPIDELHGFREARR